MRRDFTYVDDIVEGVVRVLARPPAADTDAAPHALYNIGHHEAVELETFIATARALLGRRAIRDTRADAAGRRACDVCVDRPPARATGFAPQTPLDDGLARFVAWYREYMAAERAAARLRASAC
jgi:UDP-glucuronate 4-epimerase